MKRFVILACALALAPFASAQLYKYVDKDGKTVYTDQPPADADSKAVKAPSAPASGSNSFVAKDKEAQKARDKLKEGEKKSNEVAARAKDDEERCTRSKQAFQHYAEGGRITKYNDKGERVFLGDAEIETERENARRKMEQDCKA
jgi:hypothetical protein